MPAATVGNGSQPQKASAPLVPFMAGSYEYTEPITSIVAQLGVSQQDFVVPITPGGFLRGVSLQVTSTGGVLGAGVLAADTPWNVLANVALESIDGTPILYPMTGVEAFLIQKYCRPWDGDPTNDAGYSNSVNPAFNLRFFNESRMSIGALPNTDARAQYRLRISLAPSATYFSTAPTTAPTVTVQVNLETYAQPPAFDYAGNQIAQLPDGLVLQRFVSREVFNTNGGDQILKSNRVGNLIRAAILVVRSSAGARVNLTSDPIRWRLDNTQLLNEYRAHRNYENDRTYQTGGYEQGQDSWGSAGTPTGVYAYPRFHDPGNMTGQYWLPTTPASYLGFELNGTPAGGTVEIITEDLAPAGPVPPYLMGV